MKIIWNKLGRTGIAAGLLVALLVAPAQAGVVSELDVPQDQVTAEDGADVVESSDVTNAQATLTGEKCYISLAEAMELALTNSSDVVAAQNDLAAAKVSLEQTKGQAKDYNKLLGKPSTGMLTPSQYQAIVYAPEAMTKAVEMYEAVAELQESAARLQVIQQYYTVACNGKSEMASLYAYEKAQNQLKTVTSRYNQGMATKLELLSAETQVNAARTALDAARATTVQNKRALSVLIGLDPETNWSPSTPLQYEAMAVGSISEKAQEMVEESPTVDIARLQFEMAELEYDYESKRTHASTYNGQILQLNYKTTEVQYANTQRNTLNSAKTMLENMELARQQYQIYMSNQEILEEVYRLAVLQYENGLNTQNDIQSAAADIVSNDAKRLQALLNYNIAKTAVEQGIISTGSEQ